MDNEQYIGVQPNKEEMHRIVDVVVNILYLSKAPQLEGVGVLLSICVTTAIGLNMNKESFMDKVSRYWDKSKQLNAISKQNGVL